jgi:glycosyltransferase involved in cell wall biosynthesis
MPPDATIVVATHNRASQITACVQCLLAQDLDRARFEIIVVDDGSSDDTATRLEPWRLQGSIEVVRLAERRGRGPARNAALARATGTIVVFIDSDAFAPPWFVKAHLDAHDRHAPGIVDGPAVTVGAFSPQAFSAIHVRLLAALDVGGEEFVTVNTSCRRAALEQVGGFDPDFGVRYGWEDVELGVRLRNLGLGRVKERRAFVLHERRAAPLEQEAGRQEECGANAAVYYAKHPTKATATRIRVHTLKAGRILGLAGLTSDRLVAFASRNTGPGTALRPLAVRAYLRQRYAAGLARGIAERGLTELS